MITLEDSIEINTTPDVIYNWLCKLDEHYTKWHPDHEKCINKTGDMRVGTMLYSEEYLHGELHKIQMKITKLVRNKKIEYKNNFPMSMIVPRGSFIIRKKGKNSVFIANIYCRGGKTLEKIFRSKIAALKSHMKEEGENLKAILEEKSDK
jgi:uncharacterized protein YndB with AHSA1/START domain